MARMRRGRVRGRTPKPGWVPSSALAIPEEGASAREPRSVQLERRAPAIRCGWVHTSLPSAQVLGVGRTESYRVALSARSPRAYGVGGDRTV